MSSPALQLDQVGSTGEFVGVVGVLRKSPAAGLPASNELQALPELQTPPARQLGLWGVCKLLLSMLGGYLISMLVHLIMLVSLAAWVLHEEPRHTEPLTLAYQNAGEEALPELLASSSAPAAMAPGSTSTAPMIFSTEQPLEMTGPKLATGLLNASGKTTGMTMAVEAKVGGTGPVGPQVNFFGSQATGQSFVFVLDTSGSMNDGNRYGRAATELMETLNSLTSEQKFCVIAFNNQAWPMLNVSLDETTLLPATYENKARLKAWLESLRPIGWTDPRDALALALKLTPSAIFVLSDGEFKQGPPERKLGYATLSNVNRANREHVPIHTLAFEDSTNAPVLRSLAKASGGTYRFVPPKK